jgi:hypothetical protein
MRTSQLPFPSGKEFGHPGDRSDSAFQEVIGWAVREKEGVGIGEGNSELIGAGTIRK